MKSTLTFRVIYRDTDAEGVVYYANYLAWLEAGRTELIRTLGFSLTELKKKHNLVFAVKDIFCEYFSPAVYDDEIIVETRIGELKPVRVIFEQKILRKSDSKVLAGAKVTAIPIDIKSFKPIRIPENLKNKILKAI